MSSSVATVIIIACWTALVVVWIAAAAYYARQSKRVQRRAAIPRVPIAFILVILVVLLPVDWRVLDVRIWWVQLTGGAILVLSTAFAIWARLSLGAMWSPIAVTREGHELRTTGPYGVTRHPIYTGLAGMLLGTTMLSGSGKLVPILVAGTALLFAKATTEERLLRASLGEPYVRYQHQVPRLIPVPHSRRIR